jgi:hypothetical protein
VLTLWLKVLHNTSNKMCASDCLERARTFVCDSTVEDGVFYRNLPTNEVAVRYQSKSAEFGYRIKCGKWRSNSDNGVSVNSASCCSKNCSIVLGGKGDSHVAEIHLSKLAAAIGIDLYAAHDPIESPYENPCHFLILPRNQSPDDLVAALLRLDEDIPKERPQLPEGWTRYNRAISVFNLAFTLHRNVAIHE